MSTYEIIDCYCQAWSDGDPMRREKLLASVWGVNATYTDPNVHVEGASELLAHIARIQATRPGATVWRTTGVDEHHSIARFGFQVLAPDGMILCQGTDIAFMTADGTRIERVIGFFGPIASRSA